MQRPGIIYAITLWCVLPLITPPSRAVSHRVIEPLPTVKSPPALATGKTLSLPPRIRTISPGGCIRPGQKLLLQGSNFGSPAGRTLLLSATGLRLPFKINGWADNTISATLPVDPRLRARTYTIGIARLPGGAWLGQPLPLLRVCQAATRQSREPGGKRISRGPRHNGSDGQFQTPPAPIKAARESGPDASQAPAPSPPGAAPVRPRPGRVDSLAGMTLPPPPPSLVQGTATARDMEAGEITLISTDMATALAAAERLRPYRMQVERRYPLANLGLVMSVFRLPTGIAVMDALARLRRDLPELWLEANHRYRPLADPLRSRQQARALIRWTGADPGCGSGLRLGMADSVIDTSHPAFAGRSIRQRSVLPPGQPIAPPDHGTAIASLLIGRPGSGYDGLLPGASLIAATIFRGRDPRHPDTTSELILKALDWLAGQRVQVINLSFGGPGDRIMGLAIHRLRQAGIALVAAAGNGGAGPIYPAAYPDVIAVTAIDASRRRYHAASRGDYLDLAAPGVDLWVARPGGDGLYRSGTSFAVPFVSASAALLLAWDPSRDPVEPLRWMASDLGPPGKDPEYGYGLLRAPPCPEVIGNRVLRAPRHEPPDSDSQPVPAL